VKEYASKVPDVEYLRKVEADQSYGAWEKYLVKQRDIGKR
jgi:hypothetical protein